MLNRILITAFLVLLPYAAVAGPFDDGVAAYDRKDYQRAYEIWRPLAQQGHASAQFLLGLVYDAGTGVPEDDAEAVNWYRKAAQQGQARAQYNLGLMYSKGEGVPKDYSLAYKWVNIAAASGDQSAAQVRDIYLPELMTPEQIAEGQRLAREWFAKHQQQKAK